MKGHGRGVRVLLILLWGPSIEGGRVAGSWGWCAQDKGQGNESGVEVCRGREVMSSVESCRRDDSESQRQLNGAVHEQNTGSVATRDRCPNAEMGGGPRGQRLGPAA
jgi:hypothetical protein